MLHYRVHRSTAKYIFARIDMHLYPRADAVFKIAPGDNGIIPDATIKILGLATDDIGPRLSITSITLCVISLAVVTTRLYGRACILRMVGREDYCIVVAMAAAVGLSVMMALCVDAGVGRHIWTVGYKGIEAFLKYVYLSHLLYLTSLAFARASLLLQLLRLTPSVQWRMVFWTIFGITATFSVTAFFLHAFVCGRDPSQFWDVEMYFSKNQCMDYFQLQTAVGTVNIFTDFVVWLAPLRIVWQVKLPWNQKASLTVVFLLGATVWIAAIVRLVYAHQLGVKVSEGGIMDVSYDVLNGVLWSVIEVNVALICSSLPTIRPVIKQIIPGILGTNDTGSHSAMPQHTPISTAYVSRNNNSVIKTAPIKLADIERYPSTEGFASTQQFDDDAEGSHGRGRLNSVLFKRVEATDTVGPAG
ncbi:hypothetical protein BZA05DRAFT_95452 [Tricharina praecox]|uniref:uncharacterized protein n=1 Tax=Tricharina praecox TaxID=43433 RepID=UPI0022205643|nr:uncharacterized protein BZA05DRAFT_95452 [Tricharina praecox]KAI5848352.1 hypothetical protein BZA05DRAFT_95452 [Tricharina praecox]